MPKPLSVVVITYNEQQRLPACLQSAVQVADELVVVDSFSTDDTEKIARSFGAKFYQKVYAGQVEQKQYALTKTSYEQVLALDADEVLTDNLIAELLKEKEAGFPFCNYQMNRMTNYAGKWIRHGGWYPDWKLRLWSKKTATWAGKNPHDRVIPNTQIPPKKLRGNLLHYGFESVAEHKARITDYASFGARTLFEQGKSCTLIRAYASAIFKGFRDYVFKLGFLDGKMGLVIAWLSMRSKYLKYKKLHELNRQA